MLPHQYSVKCRTSRQEAFSEARRLHHQQGLPAWETDSRLTDSDRRVLVELNRHAPGRKTICWPSVERLAIRCGKGPSAVKLCIRQLRHLGYIATEANGALVTQRQFRLLWKEHAEIASQNGPSPRERKASQTRISKAKSSVPRMHVGGGSVAPPGGGSSDPKWIQSSVNQEKKTFSCVEKNSLNEEADAYGCAGGETNRLMEREPAERANLMEAVKGYEPRVDPLAAFDEVMASPCEATVVVLTKGLEDEFGGTDKANSIAGYRKLAIEVRNGKHTREKFREALVAARKPTTTNPGAMFRKVLYSPPPPSARPAPASQVHRVEPLRDKGHVESLVAEAVKRGQAEGQPDAEIRAKALAEVAAACTRRGVDAKTAREAAGFAQEALETLLDGLEPADLRKALGGRWTASRGTYQARTELPAARAG